MTKLHRVDQRVNDVLVLRFVFVIEKSFFLEDASDEALKTGTMKLLD